MEENIIEDKKVQDKKMWKEARWGVIIICVVHFLLTAYLDYLLKNELDGVNKLKPNTPLLPVLFNYWLASWYIKRKIESEQAEKNLLLMGLKVAAVVYLIQIILGEIVMLFVDQYVENITNR